MACEGGLSLAPGLCSLLFPACLTAAFAESLADDKIKNWCGFQRAKRVCNGGGACNGGGWSGGALLFV